MPADMYSPLQQVLYTVIQMLHPTMLEELAELTFPTNNGQADSRSARYNEEQGLATHSAKPEVIAARDLIYLVLRNPSYARFS